MIGLGAPNARLQVYIANRPPLSPYDDLVISHALTAGEVAFIAEKTGNHWRKIFNVYAKLRYPINLPLLPSVSEQFETWQLYRDNQLLQQGSDHNLRFDALKKREESDLSIKLICGKQYGEQLTKNADINVTWLNDYFAINEQQRVIICPYFDYRQLSNVKITYLVRLINRFA